MTSSRKILVPLATLLAAGAVAVGSGATFSSTSTNAVSAVTAGHLSHTNSKANAAIFTLDKMKPGDTVNGSLTLTNDGTLPATFTLREPSSSNGFASAGVPAASYLHLKVTDDTATTTLYDGDFGGLGNDELKDLGTFQPGDAHTYTFSVSLSASAPNTQQDKTASATYEWVSTQLSGETTHQ
ncbi:MAG: hypothetical protein HOQ22_19520 [Nocardioidaceae bacterium]|nr:hypothetical protein [Nocardioidaceae bacterium]